MGYSSVCINDRMGVLVISYIGYMRLFSRVGTRVPGTG
jgi:hypothetical protein